MKTIFDAMAFAKAEILKSVNSSTTVQRTGDVLVDFNCQEILFGNISPFINDGFAFHYIYRCGSIELKPII
jgi:hypothetical protein